MAGSVLGDLRVLARSSGFAGLTFSLLACLEADLRTSAEARRQEVIYKWMGRYGKALLRLYGLSVTVNGGVFGDNGLYPARDARGLGRMFVMNHRSMLDIFVDLAFVEANIVSRADLSRWPVIGVAARRVGTLFVDRTSKQSGSAVINAMSEALEAGRGVLVYPEGTSFAGDEVRPFRPGAFLAASRTGAEIVPMGIVYGGQRAAFVEESFPAHYRRVVGGAETRVGLSFGEPMAVETGADVELLQRVTHERVQALVRRARAAIEV
jgi:lyso-ornithine lipid O-acyltransferase